jgi:hypothetical protein
VPHSFVFPAGYGGCHYGDRFYRRFCVPLLPATAGHARLHRSSRLEISTAVTGASAGLLSQATGTMIDLTARPVGTKLAGQAVISVSTEAAVSRVDDDHMILAAIVAMIQQQ